MLTLIRPRSSAITFDVGAAGVRAFQAAARGPQVAGRDCLRVDLLTAPQQAQAESPQPDYSRLARLVGQGRFCGSEVALVLSPPDVGFCALRVPKRALEQTEVRVREALAWEVARETRTDAQTLEVRYWELPPGHQQGLNVMAVAIPTEQALTWHAALARDGLRLRRIDVSPCALVHLARRIWTPAASELWGVLDLGLRRTTLTVVLGGTPVYIRLLAISSEAWTRRLMEAFELPHAAAEQIKRAHGIRPTERGIRPPTSRVPLLAAEDIPGVIFGLLRESLEDLVNEVNRCFAYVMQNFAEANATRLLLAGGGANLRGLAPYLQAQLDLTVELLSSAPLAGAPRWERPIADATIRPETAAAVGGAVLDLEGPGSAGREACTPSVSLLPESCHNARRRAVRRRTWTAVTATAGLLVLGAWLALLATDRVVVRLRRELAGVEAQQSELERRLALALQRRNTLAERVRALTALRQEQRLPAQLMALSQLAPQGIVLTELVARPVGSAAAPARAGREAPQAGNASAPAAPAAESRAPLVVQMRGHATDHDELSRLIEALRQVPHWGEVELLRAAREPYRTGVALAFQLECRPEETGR